VSTPDETITTVLEEIRAIAAELVDLREDVKKATQHFGDVDALQIDVEAIKAHLVKIDARLAGPPALEERLAALELKQESDDQARQDEDAATRAGAGTAGDREHRGMARDEAGELVDAAEKRQERVNLDVREDLGVIERAVFDILHASLKVRASLMLGGSIVIYLLAKALGWA
jgi:hypothetical protein